MKKIFLFSIIVCSFYCKAQLPETIIYTLDITRTREVLNFTKPKIISSKSGYNNQPYFTPDGRYIFYASNNGKGNTDIYRYDLKKPNKNSKRITKTAEAEYSPRLNPAETEISCVRVEKDTVTQHFYSYDLKGKRGKLYLPELKTLGYYAWNGGAEIIGFTLPEPFMLSKFNIVSLREDTIASQPGRTFQVFKNKIYYVDKSLATQDGAYPIRIVAVENLRTRNKPKTPIENKIAAYTLPSQEDFVILQDGTFLMGSLGKLFAYNPKRDKDNYVWREIADFKKMGIEQFYRLAVNNDNTKLAVVSYSGKKP